MTLSSYYMLIMPSIPVDLVTTVVYGTAATVIGIVTIYQSYSAWRLWREHHHHHRGQSSQGMPEIPSILAPKDKLCLLLYLDVELALGSARVVQEAPSSMPTVDVVPTHDRNDVQAFTNQVIPSVSPRALGPLTSSTADPESLEVRNDSQDAASPGIALDAAVAPTLQPLQQPEPPDVVPVQETTSTHAVANPVDPSVSCSALNHPDVPAGSSTTLHHADDS